MMGMRTKVATTIAALLLCIIVANITVCASGLDRVLQFLAWSATTSDYNMSIDIVKQPRTGWYGLREYTISEGNPMFAGRPEFTKTFIDIKNAFVEIVPDVLPKPWSTLVLLGIALQSGAAVAHNNSVFESVGEPIEYTLAFRIRW